ncbi:cytochrome P450 [Actinokineospora auranticolor]|uniref:Cytochrome P450 n=1 Tax=Actinokineospora auranticolor TaxID=155976 RepID=A0A2S6H0Z2_9PSEU|nr:cytochrome P450 [Actinokineospora auranticolor]PPK71090.1 cytochrome P450 [Actinokineospora auranticolor]
MADVTDETLLAVPVPRTCPYTPSAEYARLREREPVARVRLPNGEPAWLVTRYAEVRALLADTRFSSDRRAPGFPFLLRAKPNLTFRDRVPMLSLDPPEHGPARRAVLGEFTVRRMRELRPRVQRVVDECVDALLAGPRPADLVAALALPVPSLVICELLGVPYADHVFFQERSAAVVRRSTAPDDRDRAIRELQEYLSGLITAKAADPGDDLLGRQVRRQRAAGAEDHAELVSLATLLLIAGHETTANMISLGTMTLLEHPDQLAAVRRDPGLVPGAVEELLRYLSVVESALSRVATADLAIGGTPIREGEGVLAVGHAANHDPAAFPDPDTFDVHRDARHHVAFGYGPHQCLGQNLARLELETVFATLFRRVPTLALATPADELPYKDDATIYGLYTMPVTW